MQFAAACTKQASISQPFSTRSSSPSDQMAGHAPEAGSRLIGGVIGGAHSSDIGRCCREGRDEPAAAGGRLRPSDTAVPRAEEESHAACAQRLQLQADALGIPAAGGIEGDHRVLT